MIDPAQHAQQWSDGIIHNSETLLYFFTATPVGLCISIPIGWLLLLGLIALIQGDAPPIRTTKEIAKAESETEKARLVTLAAAYRSPAGYNRGQKD